MSFYKEVPGRKTTLESTLKFDTTPTEGSTNPVTSDGVKSAIDGAVGDASEALQEQIDDIAEKAGSGYIPKGEATVATLNGLTGQENGWLYTMTDAGTLTDGSLAVVAGDTVAWDATNNVWYKAMDYAPRQYGTNEVHNLPTTATEDDLVSGNYLALDGNDGTKKLPANAVVKKNDINRSETKRILGQHYLFGEFYINYLTGEPTPYADFKLSDYIPLEGATKLVINANHGTLAGAGFYDENFDFISGTKDYDYVSGGAGTEVEFPGTAKYLRIGVSYVDAFVEVTYNKENFVRTTRYESEQIVDVEEATYGSQMLEGEYYIKYTTGEAVAFEGFKCSDYIPLADAIKLVVNGNTGTNAGLAFYDENKAYVWGTRGYNYVSGGAGTEIYIPLQAKYLRIGVSYDDAFVKITYKQVKSSLALEGVEENSESIANAFNEIEKNKFVCKKSRFNVLEKSSLKILYIGNSWSRDSAVYVPQMLSSVGVLDYKIGILYHSGASIQNHVNAAGTNYYTYDFNDGNGWTSEANKSLEYGCQAQDWDVIIFHQVSSLSGYKSKDTILNYLPNLISLVLGYLSTNPDFKGNVSLGWLSVPAYTEGYTPGIYSSSNEMANDIIRMSKYLYENMDEIDFVIPETEAIQLARKTTLNQYGGYSQDHQTGPTTGLMYLDTSLHLIEGIGRQIAGYALVESVCNLSCLGNKVRFTENSTLEPHGDAVGSNYTNSVIAQECSKAAFKVSVIE